MYKECNSYLVCKPDFFDVTYEINPWMNKENRPSQTDAVVQWNGYLQALKDWLNVEVDFLTPTPNMPDLVFTANHGLVKDNRVVLARMNHSERGVEEPVFTKWFKQNGFETYTLKSEESFEGEGDAFIVGDTLIAGFGFRSSEKTANEIKDFFGLRKVYTCKLTNPYFYHLDTCFTPLPNGKILYYPDAIAKEDIEALTSEFTMVPIQESDAKNFACNLVVYNGKAVIPNGCKNTEEILRKEGIESKSVNLDQFLKAGGAAKCLCLRLEN